MNKKQPLLTDTPGRALIVFALPMIIGNLFQQFYNMADSIIVGRFVGENALAPSLPALVFCLIQLSCGC